mgnify:CR=1 FL=1
MANRVTFEEVKEIFSTDMTPDQITACITGANLLVTNTVATSTSPAVDAATLKEIEKWVAAHLCCMRDPRELRAKTGDADVWFAPIGVTTAWGKQLNFTWYGQTAIALDSTGKLAALGMKKGSYRAAPREDSDAYTENLTKA